MGKIGIAVIEAARRATHLSLSNAKLNKRWIGTSKQPHHTDHRFSIFAHHSLPRARSATSPARAISINRNCHAQRFRQWLSWDIVLWLQGHTLDQFFFISRLHRFGENLILLGSPAPAPIRGCASSDFGPRPLRHHRCALLPVPLQP